MWVTVLDRVKGDATTFRFNLSDNTQNGGVQQVESHGEQIYASPIIVEDDVWTVTYNPLVRKTTDSNASGVTYWPQFKFDKEKTGANTFTPSTTAPAEAAAAEAAAAEAAAAEAAAAVPGSGGGCFISTVK